MSTRRSFLAGIGAAAALRAASPQPDIRPGWDWSLPENIRPIPYSGFVTWGQKRFSDLLTVQGIRVKWSQLNPAPGEYNWKPVLDALETARQSGMRLGLHVVGVERQNVPDWAIQRFNLPVLDVTPLQQNQPWRLQIVPPWHPEVRRAYTAFMEAFGKTGIPQREDVVYGYIHGISPSRGEELFLRPLDVDEWEQKAGLTAELLGEAFRSRLSAMLSAFHGVEHKLAWMGSGAMFPMNKKYAAYTRATEGLAESAIAQGTGWRGGGIDFQNRLYISKLLGLSVSPDGYAVVDESLPIHDGRRYFGDENEEYGKSWEWRFGPVEGHEYRHRICTLRTLQVRMNFQMVSDATLRLNPDLNHYAKLTQGRHAQNSPDAWAYLRECQIRPKLTVKNLERWLIQRDLPGCRSVACERIDRFPLFEDAPDHNYDYDARRTDLRNAQSALAFQLDRKFWPAPAAAEVKVTYTDREKGRWHIESDGAKSPAVQGTGDGQRKTATFRIPRLASDFKIVASDADAVVTVVRVIRS